jgi:hypothetical protein
MIADITPDSPGLKDEKVYAGLLDVFASFKPDLAPKDYSRLWFGTDKAPVILQTYPISQVPFGAIAVSNKMKKGSRADNARRSNDDLASKYGELSVPDTVYVSNNWWEQLRGRCVAWDKWEKGDYLNYNQRLTLFTNLKLLAYRSHDLSIISDVLQFYNADTYKGHTCDELQIRRQFRTNLAPLPNICFEGNYLTVPDYFLKRERVVLNTKTKRPVEELDKEMDETFSQHLSEKGITYIKSQTGTGKTDRLIRWIGEQNLNEKKIIVSLPTYVCMMEFESRALFYLKNGARSPYDCNSNTYSHGVEMLKNKVCCSDDFIKNLQSKLWVYLIPQASYNKKDKLLLEIGKQPESKSAGRSSLIKQLMDPTSTGLYICSHSLLCRLRDIPSNAIIIDENIEEALLKETKLTAAGINSIMPFIDSMCRPGILDLLHRLEHSALYVSINIDEFKKALETLDVEAYLKQKNIYSGLFDFLKVTGDARVSTLKGEKCIRVCVGSTFISDAIRNNVPVKLMCATPKMKQIVSAYGLKNIKTVTYDLAENEGSIIQYRYHSGSKGNDCERVPDLIEVVKNTLSEEVIRKAYVLSFKNSIPLWEAAGFNIPRTENGTAIHLANSAG